jgi:hypothetical protein
MAGFCRNCGSPLGDGQGFCVKCGARVGEASQPAAAASAPPPQPGPAYAAPAPVTPAGPAQMSPVVKILIGVVAIFVVFGALAAGAAIYIGHRVHQKVRELGLTHAPSMAERAALHRIDACGLLPKADVGQAVKMDIVRAEAQQGDDPGCVYSVSGDPADMTAKHVSSLHKGELNKSQQDMVENFGRTIFHGASAESGDTVSDHPGEAPVIAFSIDNNNAQLQMRLNKTAMGSFGPVAVSTIPDLGDEAFDVAGAMLFVRKGDKLVRIMYMTCPCGRDDVLPLARAIASGL